jgi:hypothetical protein
MGDAHGALLLGAGAARAGTRQLGREDISRYRASRSKLTRRWILAPSSNREALLRAHR